MANEYLISAIIMLLGNIAATMLPYLRKKYNANKLPGMEDLKFDLIYLYNAIIAAVVQFILAAPLVGSVNADGALDIIGLIIMSFAYGYGGNKAQIEGGKLYNLWKTIRAVPLVSPESPSEP
jgi:hypothetical protein